mmetsp:Transcript_23766/g.59989  ORF Transcript_23766/g.59989 Transcript_23766/m.59989 type:complete len:272 (+) Transcript_23766:1008-1823(+)
MSHTITCLSKLHERRYFPSCVSDTVLTHFLCPFSTRRQTPVSLSHSRHVLSIEQLATSLSLYVDIATSITLSSCPVNTCRHSPLCECHTRTVPSKLQLTTYSSELLITARGTIERWPANWARHLLVFKSHIRTSLSYPAVRMKDGSVLHTLIDLTPAPCAVNERGKIMMSTTPNRSSSRASLSMILLNMMPTTSFGRSAHDFCSTFALYTFSPVPGTFSFDSTFWMRGSDTLQKLDASLYASPIFALYLSSCRSTSANMRMNKTTSKHVVW